ncbi:MAG TPA: pyridoxal-phosphate dependent enzyme [Thermoanaerobaculaceae bacterium]|nr:pyridoxal-phosphate dependent enzyme [Thermoanaerobaculaceae bacterium]HRS14723.1 pyridoxal-phosphate dependent enzyme [Thermoanaerobaculaceae bacterium]
MARFTLVCSECRARYGEHEVRYVCPVCARAQEPGGPTRGVLEVDLAELPDRWPARSMSEPEALAAFLPLRSVRTLPLLSVGGTPLLETPALRRTFGMPRLWVKDDTRNPSGSTKDRASQLVVAKALEYGYDTIVAASTGNAATALACLAAAAGLRAVVLVPASAPPAKLVQMASYGARLVPVDGNYDQAFELSLAASERFGWYNRNTAYNPFTIEGKKTAALEIAADPRLGGPDVVVVPAGDGVIVSGLAKGFADLERAGLVPRRPRLLIVQPEGSGALARALRAGAAAIAPEPGARSVADSLVVAAPRNAFMALREVRASGGGGVLVSDEAILDAIGRLARSTGVFAEPAAAAALAGLEAALGEGLVDRDERVVLMVTGTGLKDIAAAARRVVVPAAVPPSLSSLESLLPPQR